MSTETKDKKTQNTPLKSAVDCVGWFEKIANETTQDQHSIAQANARSACVKGVMGIQKLLLDYRRFVAQSGGTLHEMQKFFAPEQKQIAAK